MLDWLIDWVFTSFHQYFGYILFAVVLCYNRQQSPRPRGDVTAAKPRRTVGTYYPWAVTSKEFSVADPGISLPGKRGGGIKIILIKNFGKWELKVYLTTYLKSIKGIWRNPPFQWKRACFLRRMNQSLRNKNFFF